MSGAGKKKLLGENIVISDSKRSSHVYIIEVAIALALVKE